MIHRAILISTGDEQERLHRLESGFADHLEGRLELEHVRLGRVDSLARAYYEAVVGIDDPDALLIFCHQDVQPIPADGLEIGEVDMSDLPKSQRWLERALADPAGWVDHAISLTGLEDTGLMGVAGALGLIPETAWWQFPEVSGTVIHALDGGGFRLNPYGPWGRVAVLDGLCMMVRRGTCDMLGAPSPELKGFHFYDMDLSLRAHFAGLQNWTIPLILIHHHGGARSDDPAWMRDHDDFLAVYGDRLPVRVQPEPLPKVRP